MPLDKIETGLTQGLLAGYGGKSEIESITRGGFLMQTSHVQSNHSTYHDEWFNGSNGGGQELVQIDEERFTRLYAGGIIDKETLHELGIFKKDVIGELLRRIQELGSATRLFANCHPENFYKWGYRYEIIDTNPEVNVTISKEVITYDGVVVFVHGFLLSPLA